MSVILTLISAILGYLLFRERRANSLAVKENQRLIALREAALDIANEVLNVELSENHYQYILQRCMDLVPAATYGSILMFNHEGLLVAKASIGFNEGEITEFKLPLEESFLYIASNGNIKDTVIINRIEDIILDKNIVGSSSDSEFVLRSEISAPIYLDGIFSGMLCIDGTKHDLFKEKDIHVIDYMARQISNVMSKQKLYDEVLYLSKHDLLTELSNRRNFETKSKEKIKSLKLENKDSYLAIMDINGLKTINDTYGHSAGDRLIQQFARGFFSFFNEYGLCARYGGDEFAALIDDVDYKECIRLAELLDAYFRRTPLIFSGQMVTISFSYGFASIKASDYRFDIACKDADCQMYRYKRHHYSKKSI